MARYRIGNRYLSEEEYREEKEGKWIQGLFLLGAAGAGYVTHQQVAAFDWPRWLQLSTIAAAALVSGGILGALYRQIQILLSIFVLGGVLYLVGSWVLSTL